MSWLVKPVGAWIAGDLAASERDASGRFESSLRRTLDRCGPVLGLPDDEQPPTFLAALGAADRELRESRRRRR